jgi:DNA polymerase-3 subunit gamma/tau
MAYQSLYRRYRPQTFSAIRGQKHVVAALQGAVRDEKVGHAYLLHGPRGTGKTSSARVLAKALNCENLQPDGEPCTTCESCVAIEHGRSFDLHELDAASNNKVEDMRDLLGKVNLGTPGRAKVYLLDEAHMLTPSASNALLKTLEEPPDHVTWVLATTEPHKLVDTIRSRCQVFELGLLGAEEMEDHIRWVVADAELDVDDEAIDHVVATGAGSVRDALSALDRVVAAGGVVAVDAVTDTLLTAIAGQDATAALAAVGEATGRGRDPRVIGESALAGLRDAFLTAMGSPPPRLAESDKARADRLASTMVPAAMTSALETLGTALVDMRQAPDPRVDLEVALVRLCRPDSDLSLEALAERIEQLERSAVEQTAPGGEAAVAAPAAETPATEAPSAAATVAPGAATTATATAAPTAATTATAAPTTATATAAPTTATATAAPTAAAPATAAPSAPAPTTEAPSAPARRALAELRNATEGIARPTSSPAPPPPPPVPTTVSVPTIDLGSIRPASPTDLVELAARHLGLAKDVVVARAKEMLPPPDESGRRDPAELIPLWQALVTEYADPKQTDPEQADLEPADPAPHVEVEVHEEADIDLADLVDAPSHVEDVIEQLTEAFPGAELIAADDEERP